MTIIDAMAAEEPTLQLAPAVVVRMALWPLESLDGFGSHELAALAKAASSSDAGAYAAAYRRVLEHERALLWQRTAGDPRFMRALGLQSPPLSARAAELAARPRSQRNKRIRHMETTLYRYLARAAGRPTPGGAWAAIGQADFATPEGPQPRRSRVRLSPDLRVFQTLLRGLGARPRYRDRARLQLNPTLRRHGDAGFRFCAPTPDGRVELREIDPSPALDMVFEQIEHAPAGTLAELAERVARHPRWPARERAAAHEMLDRLAGGGALAGGLDLPAGFSDPWDALEEAAGLLCAAERRPWSHAVGALRRRSEDLAARLERIAPSELREQLGAALATVQELAGELGVPVELPATVLSCDVSLPFRVSLPSEARAQLSALLSGYERFWVDAASPLSAWRFERHAARARWLSGGRDLYELATWDEPPVGEAPSVMQRQAAWQRQLLQPAAEATLEPPAAIDGIAGVKAPLGCLYVEALRDFDLRVHGVADNPAQGYARNAALLDDAGLLRWLAERLDHLQRAHGVKIMELRAAFANNPNALARPPLFEIGLELWGGSSDAALGRARMRPVGPDRTPVVEMPGSERPVAFATLASAAFGRHDPLAARLLWSSFQDHATPEVRAAASATPGELARPRLSTRLRLPGGGLLCPRRSFIQGAQLDALLRSDPRARYRQWQRLAADLGWPALVRVAADRRPALLIPRDSPLALEALLEGARHRTTCLTVEEVAAPPWLVDDAGRHYVSELAVPFARRRHGWSGLG